MQFYWFEMVFHWSMKKHIIMFSVQAANTIYHKIWNPNYTNVHIRPMPVRKFTIKNIIRWCSMEFVVFKFAFACIFICFRPEWNGKWINKKQDEKCNFNRSKIPIKPSLIAGICTHHTWQIWIKALCAKALNRSKMLNIHHFNTKLMI